MAQLKYVSRGEPLTIPADAYNAFIDAARRGQRGIHGRQAVVMPKPRPQNATVLVQNTTGAGLDAFSVLAINSVLFAYADNNDEFKSSPCLVGTTPSYSPTRGKFAILLEPLPNNEVGWACTQGVVVAQVNVTSADHEYADVKASDATQLQSGFIGSARILYKPSGTGSLWCIVSLGRNTGPMLVTVENDGGDSGGDALSGGGFSDCSFTYTVKTLGGVTIATELTPQRARMSGIAYIAGGGSGRTPYGLIDLDSSGGVLLLDVFGEVPDPTDCE